MATKTPRIQVTLSEDAYRIVDRMADLQRSARSTIVAEIINDLAPVLGELLGTLEAAAQIRQENMRGVRNASLEAVDRMQGLVDEAEGQMNLLDEIVRKAAQPPSSNTGATNPPNALKSHNRTSGRKGASK